MKISIYIPVFNERDALRRTLRALVPEKDGHEVIVVDRGSTDGSADVVKEFPWVALVESDHTVLTSCLNQAASKGEGDVLLFLLPGAIPVRGWSGVLEKTFSQDVDAAHFFLVEAEPSSKFAASLRAAALKFGQQWVGGPASLTGLAVRRETFDEVHGFSPVPDFEWLAFAARVRESGGTVTPLKHPVQTAPRPGSRQADPWADLLDDLRAAWRHRRTESYDPVRCRRRTSAAILLGPDLFPVEGESDYMAYARQRLLVVNMEVLQSFRGVQRVVFMGGKDSTKALGQPSGLQVCPHIRTETGKRIDKILSDLEAVGIEGVLLVRGDCKRLHHDRLRALSESGNAAPCVVLADPAGEEWLALWVDTPALSVLRGWDAGFSLEALRQRFQDQRVPLEVLEDRSQRLKTHHDARALYYAGILERVPG